VDVGGSVFQRALALVLVWSSTVLLAPAAVATAEPEVTAPVAPHAAGVPVPRMLATWPAREGLGVSWARLPLIDGERPDYLVERRTTEDGSWRALDVPAREYVAELHLVDTSLPPGATAAYRVTALLRDQRSDPSPSISGTRATTVPVPGEVSALTLDVDAPGPRSRVLDPLRTVVHPVGAGSIDLYASSGGSNTASIPRPDAPGAIPVGDGDGEHRLTLPDHWACGWVRGTVDVAEVLYDVHGQLELLTATYTGRCADSGGPVSGTILLGSTATYRGVELVSHDLHDALGAPVGTSRDAAVEVRNPGRFPVEVLAEVVPLPRHLTGGTEPGAGDWTVRTDGCAERTIAPGAMCTIGVRFAPSAAGPRAAAVRLTDPVTGARRSLELPGTGIVPPGAPVAEGPAVGHVGRVTLRWQAPDVGHGTVDAVEVTRRAVGTTTWSGARFSSGPHVDAAAVPGTRYEYRLRARNEAGLGAPLVVTAQSARRDLLVTSDDGPLHAFDLTASRTLSTLDPTESATPTASPDGRTVVRSRRGTGGFDLVREVSWGGGAPSALTTLSGDELDPAVSPDGRSVAFTRVQSGRSSVWVVPLAGGTPTRRADLAAHPSWLPDGRTLVVTDLAASNGPSLTRIRDDGRRQPIPGTDGLTRPAVSPDGRHIAATTDGPTGELRLLTVSGSEVVSGPTIEDGLQQVRWTPDGRGLLAGVVSRRGTHVGLASFEVRERPLRATGGHRLADTFALRQPAYRTLGVHLTSAPHLTSAAPRIGFAVAHPIAGTTFTCRLDGGAATACTSPWVGAGVSGGNHTLVIEASEPGGDRSVTAHTFVADVTAPAVTVTGPTAPVTFRDRTTVTYGATDAASGVASYDVRYRVANIAGGYGSWVRPDSWQRTTATSRNVALGRGQEVCLSVRARDAVGNVSGWSAARCTSRPLDDRSLSASSGWERLTDSRADGGTITRTKGRGETLARGTVQARQVYLVVTRCPSCGKVEVLHDGVRIGTANLASSTTKRQVVIALPRRSSVVDGRLVVRSTSSGAPVPIDGIAVRRG
jgi:hypothetical protein